METWTEIYTKGQPAPPGFHNWMRSKYGFTYTRSQQGIALLEYMREYNVLINMKGTFEYNSEEPTFE